MTKLIWDRKPIGSILNTEYYTNPKEGFDKAWHIEQKNKKIKAEKEKQTIGIHADHELDRVKIDSGPHFGKLVCKTCNKFIKWLPKEAF